MAKLYVMVGCPGSGKSTWCQNYATPADRHVSRDDIRFALVEEDEEYFSREKEVFRSFAEQINFYLESGYNVFADATHLNKASRNKLLRAIPAKVDEIDAVYIKTPLWKALEQNEKRKGTRSYVPKSVIRRMNCQIEQPTFEEGFSKIYIVEGEKLTTIVKKED